MTASQKWEIHFNGGKMLEKVNQNLSQIEKDVTYLEKKFLNRAGYVPLIGSGASLARGLIAIAEIVTGAALAIFFIISGTFYSLRGEMDRSNAHLALGERGLIILANGAGNLLRAAIEQIPFLPLATTFWWDLSGERITYQVERYNFSRKMVFQ